jgi:hypothetical protein
MVELYFRDAPEAWHAPHHVARSDDPAFIGAANIAAGWLYAIAGPFFWAALIILLALGEMAPR